MLNLKTKILEAINRGISNALGFNLDDYDSDSNDLYISKKKVNLDAQDNQEKLNYYANKYIRKMLNNEALTLNDKETFLENIFLGLRYCPKDKKELKTIIRQCCIKFGNNVNLNWINVSELTDLSNVFAASNFNGDISKWDVSNVRNMSGMFLGATKFNQPIGDWDTSNVVDMKEMFFGASSFNRPIENWNTSKVLNMFRMFGNARRFNQSIGKWDVSNVQIMSSMFAGAKYFNQPIGNWDVRKVTNVNTMFGWAKAFNQPLRNWKLKRCKNAEAMFLYAESFNQDISNWTLRKNIETNLMFSSCPIEEKNKPKFGK